MGKEPMSIPSLELFTVDYILWCDLPSVVWIHNLHCCWHCPQPCLNHGKASNWPWYQSVSLQRSSQRSIEVRYRIAVVMHLDPLWELWKQPRSQSCLCMPSKPTAAMARAIPAIGASIVHLDIPWMLSLESQWRQHKFMDQ